MIIFFGSKPNQAFKFRTKSWIEINYASNITYTTGTPPPPPKKKKKKTTIIRLCYVITVIHTFQRNFQNYLSRSR